MKWPLDVFDMGLFPYKLQLLNQPGITIYNWLFLLNECIDSMIRPMLITFSPSYMFLCVIHCGAGATSRMSAL